MGLQFAGPDRRPDLLARSPPGQRHVHAAGSVWSLDADGSRIWERGGQGGREHFGSGEGYDSGGEMDPGGDLVGESESLRQGWPSLDGFCHSVRACPWIFARGFEAALRLLLLLEREDDEEDASWISPAQPHEAHGVRSPGCRLRGMCRPPLRCTPAPASSF